MDAIIEYSHRLIAALTSVVILASAVNGWRKVRSIPWVRWPPVVTIPFLIAVSIFGALAVLRGLEPGWAALDLGSALMVQALLLVATAVAFYLHRYPFHPGRLSFQEPFARLSLGVLFLVFVVLVSGVLVAADGTLEGCLGWPQGSDGLPPPGLDAWPQIGRWTLAILASILIVAAVLQAWRTRRTQKAVLITATILGALWLAESVLGAILTIGGRAIGPLVLHVATAATLWAMVVLLAVLAGLEVTASATKR
jgi:heme A synthase